MLHQFPFYLMLVLGIVLLTLLAKKIKVAYPVLLVLAGLGVSFIPGIPKLTINPEMIFIIFLPPLLYEAAWSISWKELWRWRRIISSFAFVVVFFTALTVAIAANYFIPGFSLALGFLLGGIVSPPDAVSAGTILKSVKVPRRMASILEGESLLNDASSLIIFRFALVAVATGQFIWQDAALQFVWMVSGGIAIGLLIGFVFMKMHKYLPTDANTDIVLSILAPYLMYISAEQAHSSGVLAVVSGGLLLANNQDHFLNSTSRLRGLNVWDSLSFLLNGLVFMMIGLALPAIRAGLQSEGISLLTATGYGLAVTLILIVARFVAAYAAVVVTLVARNFIEVADPSNPGIKGPSIIGWTGMRGVVSLAAALSIPVQLSDGTAFPQRNLILFITFTVILFTLVLQGLTLPLLISRIHMRDPDETIPTEEREQHVQMELAAFTLEYMRKQYASEIREQPVLKQLAEKWEMSTSDEDDKQWRSGFIPVYRDVLKQQRDWLHKKNRKDKMLDEDVIRRHLLRLDLEEEKLKYL